MRRAVEALLIRDGHLTGSGWLVVGTFCLSALTGILGLVNWALS